MKTLMLRVCYLGLAVSTVLLGPGAKEQANADVPDPIADVLPPLLIADADAEIDYPAPLAAPPPSDTNAPAKPPVMVQEPSVPSNLKVSPAMAEVLKLVQAGVGDAVLMAYITNSTDIFSVDSDTIVYLNDLGVGNHVLTALIQHEASPETAARRAAATAVQPLPPGVAITKPAADVYPPPVTGRTYPAAGQTSYPGDFATVTDTNAPASDLPPAVETAAPVENVTVNHFYSSLAPYGSWMDVEGYGLCWRPTVAVTDPYWRPYSHRGRWMWSDAGWYWYSDYSWGWAPFHYGRWCSYPSVGWLWVPGTVWAPSWVTWRYSGSYCGWAPLPPGCGYRSGIGLTWYGRGVSVGFDFGLGSHCYSYVPINRFCDWNVSRHCLPDNRIHVVHRSAVNVNKISARNNSIVNHGIEPNTIAKATRTKIPTMKIRDGGALPVNHRTKPERLENNGNAVAVVRPQLPRNPTPAPTRGTATRGTPTTMANNAVQAAAPANRPQAAPRSAIATAGAPRANVNTPSPTPPTQTRSHGTATRHDSVVAAPQNNVPAPNRPTAAQPAPRQTAPSAAAPRNSTPAPAARNSSPLIRQAPPVQNPPSRLNSTPAAPPRNNINQNIRSFANPQPSAPQARPSHPMARATPPVAASQPAARPQFSAPRAEPSRPSVSQSAPTRSAPPVVRSAPSGGGGGGTRSVPSSGGGGRSSGGGGKNRGD